MSTSLYITTADGVRLAANVFEPEGEPCALVVINPAMAVRARFYRHYASYLRDHGYVVVTYDYRGMGGSAIDLSVKADLVSWAKTDFAAVIDYAKDRFPALDILVVGHSFGGQVPRLSEHTRYVSGMLAISAQYGYWKLWPMPARWGLFALWYFFMPVAVTVLGYFPAKMLRLGEDLPSGAARQWARWCRSHQYFFQEHNVLPELNMSDLYIRFVGFSDDWMAPARSIEELRDTYAQAVTWREYIKPEQYHLEKIGHFGFFSKSMQDTLWPHSLTWLEEVQNH
ncbi:MAG: alpha/beta fold hydrolase [Gammaproteobacteria bacterium]|jgi:predicted alpha/beta hydrolase